MSSVDYNSNIKTFINPSFEEAIQQSLLVAKNMYQFDVLERCSICQNKEDFIFYFTEIIYILDSLKNKPVGICKHHKKEKGTFVWDCYTGEDVFMKSNKTWFKNLYQKLILNITIGIKFTYSISKFLFVWKIIIPVKLKTNQM